MPDITAITRDAKGEATQGPSSTSAPEETTAALRQRAWSSRGLGSSEDVHERRRAWLSLLGVAYHPTQRHDPCASHPLPSEQPADTSGAGSSSIIHVAPQRQGHQGVSAADESEDGWRESFDSSLANGETIDSGHGDDDDDDAQKVLAAGSNRLASMDGDGDGGWQLAESKRTKRSKAAAAAAAAHDYGVNGSQASLASSSQLLDGSLVDLGSQQQHSESTPGTSIAGSSALTSSSSSSPSTSAQSQKAAGPSSPRASPRRSRLLEESIFSDLAVDVSTDRIEDQGKPRRRGGGGGGGGKSSSRKKKKHSRKQDVSAATKNGFSEPPAPTAIFSLEAAYSSHLPPHRDERQVDLDVRRSFVSEPDTPHRRARRRQLQDLIVGVLRRHPGLSYYQGYHDVVSVLLVVLVPDVRSEEKEGNAWPTEQDFQTCLTATTRLSLLYLRDFMAPSLEPCLGWLKALRNVVRSADGDFARDVVERAGGGGALPFFALSWLITLLSHDAGPPECEAARRVMDVVLIEGPVGMLWILAGLVLEAQVKAHSEEGSDDDDDPDMLHHSLSKLPTRLADDEEGSDAALQRVFARAAHLRKLYSGEDDIDATSPPWQGIMGPKSVLCTWPAAQGLDWAAREAQADGCLPPVPGAGEKIKPSATDGVVLDPYPTPPGSDGGFYDGDGDAAPPPSKHGRRRPSQSRAALPSTSTALFIFGGAAVVVVASAAAVMLSSSGPGGPGNAAERAARMRTLFNDAAHLGKGLARIVAMTAGGAAARGGA